MICVANTFCDYRSPAVQCKLSLPMSPLAPIIKSAMEQRNLSQPALAKAVNDAVPGSKITRQTVQHWLKESIPHRDLWKAISAILGIPLHTFAGVFNEGEDQAVLSDLYALPDKARAQFVDALRNAAAQARAASSRIQALAEMTESAGPAVPTVKDMRKKLKAAGDQQKVRALLSQQQDSTTATATSPPASPDPSRRPAQS